jgi:hypothetical protein
MVFSLCEHKLPNGEICAKYTIDSSQHFYCDEHFIEYLTTNDFGWISMIYEYSKFHILLMRRIFTF